MKTLVIEREAVKNNIGVIKERAGEAVIYAVLTGDGQGAGLVELARLLREEGIGRFAVSEPAEAAALRRAGFVEEEILMLRPTVDRAELEQLIDLNVARAQGGGLGALLRRWLAARRRTVRVNGQRARILGAIGAIETVVDVTDLKCSAGDPAVFDIDPLYARGFVREYR